MKMKSTMKGKCTDSGIRVKQAQVSAAAKKMKNNDYAKQLKKEETGMY